jgi:hypothetical protein
LKNINKKSNIIKSIYDTNKETLENIVKLYGKVECDITYSIGSFYKGLEEPKFKFDINPQTSGIVQADSRNIPIKNNTFNMTMFDPPFLATTGKSLTTKNDNNIINKRFSVFPNEIALHQYYIDTLQELYRITKDNGYIIFKCQDKVSSAKQYISHCFIWQEAIKIGWYPKDLFILQAKNRIVASWQRKQQHSRKFHSYFWIFQKKNIEIKYINNIEKV